MLGSPLYEERGTPHWAEVTLAGAVFEEAFGKQLAGPQGTFEPSVCVIDLGLQSQSLSSLGPHWPHVGGSWAGTSRGEKQKCIREGPAGGPATLSPLAQGFATYALSHNPPTPCFPGSRGKVTV